MKPSHHVSLTVLFFALHTVHIVLITMGCGVRDRVHVICNASAWCPALYPCQVLYINVHLAPILLFPSCHLTEKAVRDTYSTVHYLVFIFYYFVWKRYGGACQQPLCACLYNGVYDKGLCFTWSVINEYATLKYSFVQFDFMLTFVYYLSLIKRLKKRLLTPILFLLLFWFHLPSFHS